MMKRFYKKVEISERENGYTIKLDGKEIKTPERSLCLIPTREMAAAIAREWELQEDEIDTFSMPMTRLANTATDRVDKNRSAIVDELVGYAKSDQVCYRAENPSDLVKLQDDMWNPLLARLKEEYGIQLQTGRGIVFVNQDEQEVQKIRSLIEKIESFHLTAFYQMTTVTGSVAIAINLYHGHISSEQAWAAGQLDEDYQISQWGVDEEAEIRRNNLKKELDEAVSFLSL